MMQEVKDSISALVQQELRYTCPDYLSVAAIRSSSTEAAGTTTTTQHCATTPNNDHHWVNMVEEFASVVTDPHLTGSASMSLSETTLPMGKKSISMKDVRDVDNVMTMTLDARTCESFRFWRQQMFDWACLVVDSFGMDREVVAVSFSLLDRYMARESARPGADEITRDDFQLFSMTSLYLAVKMLEPYPRKIGVEALVEMSRGFYTEDDIAVTEREMLVSLEWLVNPPTALSFTRLLWSLFPGHVPSSALLTSATLTEIAVADSFFVSHQPSLVGLASVIMAARLHRISDLDMQHFLLHLEDVLPFRGSPAFATVYRQLEVLYS